MQATNVPLCLKRARQEVLLALGAPSEVDADEHRKLADEFFIEAVQDLHKAPDREHDWSSLRPARKVSFA